VARCLLIGGEERALGLVPELRARGHAVRASASDGDGVAALERAGAEAVLGDPDRVGTLVRALEHVTVAAILLGSAPGTAQSRAALHTTRLDMLLSKIVDSTVRGIVYEASGAVDAAVLAGGAERVRAFCADARIPHAVLVTAPERWREDALAAIEGVLTPVA
jgi:hypothetical protein